MEYKDRKKTRVLRGLIVGAMLGFLMFARAYDTGAFGQGTDTKHEEIDLSLTDTGTGHLQFNSLEKVLEYTNSEEQQKDDETERVNVYPKEGGWALEGQSLRSKFDLYGNQIWKGVNPAVDSQPLTTDLEIKPYDEKDKSIIRNGIRLHQGAELEQLLFNGYWAVEVS